MVVSNDVFDNQFQACCGSINPTGESVLEIRIKVRFAREGIAVPSEAHGDCGNR